jgi:hypothetical protein
MFASKIDSHISPSHCAEKTFLVPEHGSPYSSVPSPPTDSVSYLSLHTETPDFLPVQALSPIHGFQENCQGVHDHRIPLNDVTYNTALPMAPRIQPRCPPMLGVPHYTLVADPSVAFTRTCQCRNPQECVCYQPVNQKRSFTPSMEFENDCFSLSTTDMTTSTKKRRAHEARD